MNYSVVGNKVYLKKKDLIAYLDCVTMQHHSIGSDWIPLKDIQKVVEEYKDKK